MYKITRKLIRTNFITYKMSYGIKTKNRKIENLTCDKRKIQHLCALFNRYRLEEVHLDDVLEDFLSTLTLEE